jgi:glycosyltransferase involved in cell wall biosynthesis
MKPVLFVTNHVAPSRVGALEALARRVPLDVVVFGGASRHGAAPTGLGRPVSQRGIHALAASGRHAAVICGTAGRVALPAAYTGARRARVPFILWTSLWAHPRTAAHTLSYLPTLALYRRADAVVTYGGHVSAYVRARGARRVLIAPQSVDNDFWGQPSGPTADQFTVLFAGRDAPEKGLDVLREAWDGQGRLTLISGEPDPVRLRNFYAAAHVLVMPSLRTRDFREPWGLVANEAMNQRTAIIASDQVGAAAGGLVRHERNGLIVPAGDAPALRGAIGRLRADPQLRDRLAANGLRDVGAFSHEAWAAGFAQALREVGGW